MASHQVSFDIVDEPVQVPTGTLLTEAARLAGVEVLQPCGGQGRCGRCAVQVLDGTVRRRSTLRLSPEDVEQGFALACQTVVEEDVVIHVPPQEKIERHLTTDLTVAEVVAPPGYDIQFDQTVRRVHLSLVPPNIDNQTDDLSRLLTALRQQADLDNVTIPLPLLRKIGSVLREGEWQVTAVLDIYDLLDRSDNIERLIDLLPGHLSDETPIWGVAIDIGTTTVTVWLVNLITGKLKAQASEYNGQISRGEDVISRIVYASKNGGGEELRISVQRTINDLIDVVCKRASARRGDSAYLVKPEEIVKATIAGNSTMIHLFLGVPAASIRLSPFVTALNHVPLINGNEVGLNINALGTVDCLPGIASYVGSDITSGVLSSGMDNTSNMFGRTSI